MGICSPVIMSQRTYKKQKTFRRIVVETAIWFLDWRLLSEAILLGVCGNFRKIAVICCSVFLTNSIEIQALTVQALLIGFFLLQLRIRPYNLPELNSTELSAILVATITIYSGLYYLTESLSDGSSWFFFILIVSANVLFLVYWVIGFLGHIVDIIALGIPCLGRLLKPHILDRDPYIEAFIERIPASNPSYALLTQVQEMKQFYGCLLQSPTLSSNLGPVKRPQYQPRQPDFYSSRMSEQFKISSRQLISNSE